MMEMMISSFIYKFLFVLSIIYVLKYIIELTIRLFQTEVEPIKITKTEGVFYYLAISYIITFSLI